MSTPINEKEQFSFPAFAPNNPDDNTPHERHSSDEDGTLRGQEHGEGKNHNVLRVATDHSHGQPDLLDNNKSPLSLSQQRDQARRLDDDLEMLRAEQVVSHAAKSETDDATGRSKSLARSRSRTAAAPVDDFDIGTTPIHEKTKIYQPPAHPTTKIAKLFKKIHNSVFLVRWFFYIAPVAGILSIPIALGFTQFPRATVGDVRLAWFGIWLEVVWLTLWLGRVILSPLRTPSCKR